MLSSILVAIGYQCEPGALVSANVVHVCSNTVVPSYRHSVANNVHPCPSQHHQGCNMKSLLQLGFQALIDPSAM